MAVTVISAEALNKALDILASAYLRALGTSGSGYGVGESGDTYGSTDNLSDLVTHVTTMGESDAMGALLNPSISLKGSLTTLAVVGAKMRPYFASLDAHFRKVGNANYSTLSTFLDYMNTGAATKWQCLQDYRFRSLYNAIKGGSNYPNPYALYKEVLKDTVIGATTYSNGLGKFVVGTGLTTVTTPINTANEAGGIISLFVSGFAGSSDTVTVTGTFFDPATETTETSKTATFTVNGNGTFYRVGGTAASNALIVSVSGISVGASITASTTIYVQSERPPFRSGTCGADTVSSTTVGLDDNASSVTDFYVGMTIATNADRYTQRTITAYNGSTKVATVNSAWGTNPTASSSLFRIWRPQLPL